MINAVQFTVCRHSRDHMLLLLVVDRAELFFRLWTQSHSSQARKVCLLCLCETHCFVCIRPLEMPFSKIRERESMYFPMRPCCVSAQMCEGMWRPELSQVLILFLDHPLWFIVVVVVAAVVFTCVVCIYVYVEGTHARLLSEIGGQPNHEFKALVSGHQTWWQVPLVIEHLP